MKKEILMIAAGTLIFSMSASAEDQGWNWFAGSDENFVMEPAVSFIAGSMSPKNGDSGNITGLELSFNCPLLQPPTNSIRQQISMTKFDENGLEVTSIEINPHYVAEISPGLFIGGGPGFGYVSADTSTKDTDMFAFQLGTSVRYNISELFFLGGEARYQITQNEHIGGAMMGHGMNKGMNNWRVALKAGISF